MKIWNRRLKKMKFMLLHSCQVKMNSWIFINHLVIPFVNPYPYSNWLSGIKTIIIPKDNAKDIDDIPKSVQDDLEIILADHIDTVLEHALVK